MDGEVIVERRRQWTPEQKEALMAEVEAEGGRVSVVARRHGISTSLLYNWRSAWKAAVLSARPTAVRPAEFIPLGVVADAPAGSPPVPMSAAAVCPRGVGLALAERAGVIEIDLPDGVRVRVDSGVNEKALRPVLSALPLAGMSLILYAPVEGSRSVKRIFCLVLVATLLFGSVLAAAPTSKNAKVTLVYQHELPNVPGKSIKGVLVEYGPGGYSPCHFHPKSAFIYATVLEGAIRSQVNDGPVTT